MSKVITTLEVSLLGQNAILVVMVFIKNKGYRFLLDTGCSITLVGKALADKLGLISEIPALEENIINVGNNPTKSFRSFISLRIGGFVMVNNLCSCICNIQHINDALINGGIIPVDGIIGLDVLLKSQFIINLKNLTLEL